MRSISFIALLLLINPFTKAGIKESNDPLVLIGKRLFESPLNEWCEKYEYHNAIEDFQVEGPVIFAKNYQKGWSMMLDINFVLNSISLYQKGGYYQQYLGKLPFNLRFGMNRDSLYRIIDLRLTESDDNPYILTRIYNDIKVELLFNDRGLNQINLFANDSLKAPNDKNFVRLVHNGNIISGDCDTAFGKMTYDDGLAYYEGEWKNNFPHGQGYFKDKNNNTYKGEFRYGYFWGKGELKVSNQYVYNGEFLLSRRNGTGTCNFIIPKGEAYEGRWKADEMSGLGKYSKGSKFYYYGNMAKNQFNGVGKIVTSEGWLEGTFKDGMPNGQFKQYLKKENLTIEGQYVNGKREGKFKITDESKKVTYKLFEHDIEMIDK